MCYLAFLVAEVGLVTTGSRGSECKIGIFRGAIRTDPPGRLGVLQVSRFVFKKITPSDGRCYLFGKSDQKRCRAIC